LQAEFVQNGLLLEFEGIVEHAAVFHENYFICSSLPHLQIQDLYSYLIGTTAMGASANRDTPIPVNSIGSLFKCLQYKNTGSLKRVNEKSQANQNPSEQQQMFGDSSVMVDQKYIS
jgi:hypothetical protein